MTDLGEWGIIDEPPPDEGDAPKLYYPTLVAFVEEQLVQTYRRELEGPGRTWCPAWWNHAEAIARLEALWRAWEHLRLDPATGISVWFRDHADHHMAVLLDPDGPFKGCSPERGHSHRLEPLPTEAPPPGVFALEAEPQDDADDDGFVPDDEEVADAIAAAATVADDPFAELAG